MSEQSRSRQGTLAQAAPVRILRHALEAVTAFVVASYAMIICLQNFYRFVLNSSLVWSEEVVRYGLLWGVMLGAAVASDRGAHVALDPLRGSVSPAAYRIIAWVSGLLVITFCAVVGWYGWQYVSRLWMMSSPATQIPMYYVFISIPVGCALMALFTIVHLVSGTFQPEHDVDDGIAP